jgi:hypothetical protein
MEPRSSTLDALIAILRRRFGDQAAQRGSATRAPRPADVIPTGFAALDRALPNGGIPRGHITELLTAPTAGATTLALHVIAHAQALGVLACYLDLGATFAAAYAANCGVDLSALLLARPQTATETVETIAALITSECVGVLLVDALPQLLAAPQGTANLVALLRRLVRGLAASPFAVLVLNPPTHHALPAPAIATGQALMPIAALRLRLVRERWLYDQACLIGCQSQVFVMTPPFTAAGSPVSLSLTYPIHERLP